MKILKTAVGTFKLDFDPNNDFYCTLLDNKGKIIANIYDKHAVRGLKKIKHISELVDLGIVDNMTYGSSRKYLIDELLEWLENAGYEPKEILDTIDSMLEYENVVGDWHFIVDYDRF